MLTSTVSKPDLKGLEPLFHVSVTDVNLPAMATVFFLKPRSVFTKMSLHALPPDETLEQIFRGEIDALYRTALRILGTKEAAEDAVQDAYIRIAHPAVPHAMPEHPRGWMFRVLRNLCIDRLRSRKSRLRVVTSDGEIETLSQHLSVHRTPETELLSSDALERVARAMDAMPEDQSEVLSLYAVEGLSYREIATIIGVPVGTIRSRLNRARQSLRTLVEANDLPQLPSIREVRS